MTDSPASARGGRQDRTSILMGQFLLNGTCKHALAGGLTKLNVSAYILLSSAKSDISFINIVTEQTSLMVCPLEANSAVIDKVLMNNLNKLKISFYLYVESV